MDNNKNEKYMSDSTFADLSVDAILAEFKAETEVESRINANAYQSSSSISMDSEGGSVADVAFRSDEGFSEPYLEHKTPQFEEAPSRSFDQYSETDFTAEKSQTYYADNENFNSYNDDIDKTQVFNADIEKVSFNRDLQESKAFDDPDATVVFAKQPHTDEPEIWNEEVNDTPNAKAYAPSGEYEQSEYAQDDFEESEGAAKKLLSPLIGLIAASSVKREEKRRAAQEQAEAEAKKQIPEMDPEKAARLYVDQALAIRLRCLFATALSVVLVWLSYGLPAMGILGASPLARTFVCLIFELIVILIGLDIFTNGIVTLFKGAPGLESLIAVSALVSVADAVYIIISENTADGLPFCAVSALSMTFALWGSYLNCKSFAISFRTASIPKAPSLVLSEDGGEELGRVLVKVRRPITGFVRKTEEADIFEKAFALFSPLFMIFALVLTLLCFFASDDCTNFVHTLSAAMSVSASFSAVIGFSLPFYVLTRRLARSGVAIAGYSGCADLGTINQVVIKDNDLFPTRTLSIANVNVEDGFHTDKVISYASSMIAAAGMGIAPVFTELMKKNGYSMQKVEDFACHEGGGVLARINGDQVYLGTSSFMKLMGIRVRKGIGSASAVFVSINDELAGIFEINYVPVTSVQKGLVTLLRGNTEPVFAIRDFNITPLLVKQKFRLPKESYDFPAFADRYRISSAETEETGSVAAVFSRGGLNSVAGVVKRGKTLYRGLLLCVALSIVGAFAGMLIMLAMCWGGVYDSASCGNAISFMLFWLAPVLVVAFGLRR